MTLVATLAGVVLVVCLTALIRMETQARNRRWKDRVKDSHFRGVL